MFSCIVTCMVYVLDLDFVYCIGICMGLYVRLFHLLGTWGTWVMCVIDFVRLAFIEFRYLI